MVCTGFVLTDMLDGTLARIQGSTGVFGAFLDSTLDRISDASVFAGIAIWLVTGGHDRLLAAVALFCLVAGLLVSYAKARAEGVGLSCDVGIAERSERLLIGLVAIGLAGLGVPYVLSVGLWILAVLSAITFGQRVYAVRQAAAARRPTRRRQRRSPAARRARRGDRGGTRGSASVSLGGNGARPGGQSRSD